MDAITYRPHGQGQPNQNALFIQVIVHIRTDLMLQSEKIRLSNWFYLQFFYLARPFSLYLPTYVAITSSYESLHNLIYRVKVGGIEGATIIKIFLRLLKQVSEKVISTEWSTSKFSPMWGNPQLPCFLKLPCTTYTTYWSGTGLKRVDQLFREGKSEDFANLRRQFSIPPNKMFLNFQLHHAVASQFPGLQKKQIDLPLENLLCNLESTKLISIYYSMLLSASKVKNKSFRWKWETDVDSLSQDDCEEIEKSWMTTLISSKDKVIHLKFFHHSYDTPSKLLQFHLSDSNLTLNLWPGGRFLTHGVVLSKDKGLLGSNRQFYQLPFGPPGCTVSEGMFPEIGRGSSPVSPRKKLLHLLYFYDMILWLLQPGSTRGLPHWVIGSSWWIPFFPYIGWCIK